MPVVITIYSTEWCAFCKTEKQWLDSLGHKYISKMIDSDDEALAELESLNVGTSVPVTVINGKVIRGFDRPSILAALTTA